MPESIILSVDEEAEPYTPTRNVWKPDEEAQKERKLEEEQEAKKFNDTPFRFLLSSLIEHLSDRSVGLTPLIESDLMDLKDRGIIIHNAADVRGYLMNHPDMDSLLLFVCNRALKLFNEATEVSLEVYHDPEIKDEYLTLYIRQDEYKDNIKAVIRELRSEYKNALIESSGWLLVTTDYNPPGMVHG